MYFVPRFGHAKVYETSIWTPCFQISAKTLDTTVLLSLQGVLRDGSELGVPEVRRGGGPPAELPAGAGGGERAYGHLGRQAETGHPPRAGQDTLDTAHTGRDTYAGTPNG